MKNAIVFGGGSKNCVSMIDMLIKHNYQVYNIGSSLHPHPLVKNVQTNWEHIDLRFVNKYLPKPKNINFVFFNQNSSSLCMDDFELSNNDILGKYKLLKDWNKSMWLSCQMPFMVLHTLADKLANDCKVGWMLSSNVDHNKKDVHTHPDYSTFKFFNLMAMHCFDDKNNFSTFGIMPHFNKSTVNKLSDVVEQILNESELHCKIYKF